MFQVMLSFRENNVKEPVGFEMGDMCMRGDYGEIDSRSGSSPDQSMMLVLSTVELLDGVRRFLSTPKVKDYEFIGVDSTFSVVFNKNRGGQIDVRGVGRMIHTSDPKSLKAGIEQSVIEFTQNFDLPLLTNKAEAADFHCAWADFRSLKMT